MHDENHLKHSGSLDEALTHLVKSIAIEEEALATLMRAEADKTLAFVGKERDLPTNPSTSEFIHFNQTLTKILDSILMAEWMLMKKIDSVMHFQHMAQPSSHEKVGTRGNYGFSSLHKESIRSYNELEEIDY